MSFKKPKSLLLGSWKIEPLSGSVIGPNGATQHLEPKVMEVLVFLALRANEVVTREKLLGVAWVGSVNADEQLTIAISKLRRTFHDDPRNPDYIETVPKRGYRLIQEVRAIEYSSVDKNADPTESENLFNGRNLGLLGLAILVLALIYVAIDMNGFSTTRQQEIAGDKSIAVLPFINMSEDPGNEYFSDGLSEEIINFLSQVPGLKVIGRTSSFSFKGKSDNLRAIGQALGVKTLLEGSVRKEGDRVRIIVQLVDASDGTNIWSETYDRTLTDIFTVQDDIASSVVDALDIQIMSMSGRGKPTDNMEAYSAFLKARLAVNRLEWREALELLELVIQLDPQFAEAHELLAYSYWYAAYNGIDAEEALRKTYEAASAAIAIDPDLIFAQRLHRSTSAGTALYDFEASEWAYRQQPADPMVLDSLVYLYTYGGYKEKAVRIARQYVEVDPLSLDANLDQFGALYSAGRVNEAMQTLEIVNQIGLGPSNWQWTIAGIMLAEGDDEAAIEYFEALLRLYDYPNLDWVRELVEAARDPVSGQDYLDRRIPEIMTSLSEADDFDWRAGLNNWYLYFGFIDRYFELILAENLADVDERIWHGHVFRHHGFSAHPDYLRLATDLGIVEVWEKRGPPDFCREKRDSWICE